MFRLFRAGLITVAASDPFRLAVYLMLGVAVALIAKSFVAVVENAKPTNFWHTLDAVPVIYFILSVVGLLFLLRIAIMVYRAYYKQNELTRLVIQQIHYVDSMRALDRLLDKKRSALQETEFHRILMKRYLADDLQRLDDVLPSSIAEPQDKEVARS